MVVNYSVKGPVFATDKPSLWSEQPVESPFDVHPFGDRIALPGVLQNAQQQFVLWDHRQAKQMILFALVIFFR